MAISSSFLLDSLGRPLACVSTDDAWVTGKQWATKCLNFVTASHTRVDCGIATCNFERTDKYAVSFWYKGTGATDNELVGNWYDPTTTIRGWRIYSNVGKLSFMFNNHFVGGNRIWVSSTSAINSGSWKHLVLTYDGSSSAGGVKMYIGSVPDTVVVTYNSLSATTISTAQMQIGGNVSYLTSDLTGRLCELGVFNRDITAAEVAKLYNGGKPCDPRHIFPVSDIRCYYQLGTNDTYDTASEILRRRSGAMINMSGASIVTDAP